MGGLGWPENHKLKLASQRQLPTSNQMGLFAYNVAVLYTVTTIHL